MQNIVLLCKATELHSIHIVNNRRTSTEVTHVQCSPNLNVQDLQSCKVASSTWFLIHYTYSYVFESAPV